MPPPPATNGAPWWHRVIVPTICPRLAESSDRTLRTIMHFAVALGHSSALGRLHHSAGDVSGHALVEDAGDDVIVVQFALADDLGDGMRGIQLHLVVDVAGARIQYAAKEAGEAQDIVDLVGVVGAACGDDAGEGSSIEGSH